HNIVLILTAFLLACTFLINSTYAGEQSKNAVKGEKITVRVNGLSCPFCAYGLEKKLKSLNGVAKLEIKINDGLVNLFLKEGAKLTEAEIQKKVKEAGFTPREITFEKPVTKSESKYHNVALKIEGMQCQGCVSRVEAALNKINCAKEVSVSLEKNEATVLCSGDEKDRGKLIETVEKLGFKAKFVGVNKASVEEQN
ncbi:MAG: heavy-metal-associated domain-containing protein, partial [bacterium]